MSTRTTSQRQHDTLKTLQQGGDVWVASASATGEPYLVALTFFWDGSRLIMATAERNKTARNLARGRWTRTALVATGEVVILEGSVETIPVATDDELAVAFAAATGYDAREMPEPWVFLRLTPSRVQAMRTPEEEAERTIMLDGRWRND